MRPNRRSSLHKEMDSTALTVLSFATTPNVIYLQISVQKKTQPPVWASSDIPILELRCSHRAMSCQVVRWKWKPQNKDLPVIQKSFDVCSESSWCSTLPHFIEQLKIIQRMMRIKLLVVLDIHENSIQSKRYIPCKIQVMTTHQGTCTHTYTFGLERKYTSQHQ